jgi:flagellar biosynthesis/type III secretory pathway M-ring protein FliF/YscJ
VITGVPETPRSSLPPWLEKLLGAKNFAVIAAIGAAAMLLLVGGAAFLFMNSRGNKRKMTAEAAAAVNAAAAARELPPTPEEIERQIHARIAEQQALQAKQQAEELMKMKIPAVSTKKTEVLTRHISSEAKKDPTAMAHVVRSWLHGEDRR